MLTELRYMKRNLEQRFERKKYRSDIVGYARDRHNIWMWGRLREACEAIVTPPHKVMFESANGVGKTMFIGMVIAWFHDTFNPGQGIVTAPNFRQIQRTSWKEARGFLRGAPGLKPKDPSIYDNERHRFDGFTSVGPTGFQGTHEADICLIFEEATGIAEGIWIAARGIASGGTVYQVAALNPTDSTSAVKAESETGTWKVIRVSAFEHPNILRNLCGLDDIIRGAVTLGWSPTGEHVALLSNMAAWGDRAGCWSEERQGPSAVDLHDPGTYGFDAKLTPIEIDRYGTRVSAKRVIKGAQSKFPARFWNPGPDGEARICGRYPAQAAYAIFNEAAFNRSFQRRPEVNVEHKVEIGCDVARFGDDTTVVWVRFGMTVVRHEVRLKQSTSEIAGLLKSLCREYSKLARVVPWVIPVRIDDTGVGGGVVDQAENEEPMEDGSMVLRKYAFVGVNFGQSAVNKEDYPNARSEMLFRLADLMNGDAIHMGHVSGAYEGLRRQATMVKYRLDSQGRRVAEPKADMKKRVGSSPDDLDALALCFYTPPQPDIWINDSMPTTQKPEYRKDLEPGNVSELRERHLPAYQKRRGT